jgi:hypothetical protein
MEPRAQPPRRGAILLLAWLAVIGFDLFLHAGLLARLYSADHPFLLPPFEALRRIPLGYLAFGLQVAALLGLMLHLGVYGARAGLRFGLIAGAVVWGALILGLASIATAPLPLMLGWLLGQTAELGLAGAIVGHALGGAPLRRLTWQIVVLVVALVALTIVLQSLGFAPPLQTVGG